jgi:hypothetical protein
MARTKPPFLSALGVAFEIFKAISDAVIEAGGNDESLRSLLNDPDKCHRVALEIVGHKPALQTGSPYRGGPPSKSSDLPPHDFRITVTSVKHPIYTELKAAYDWVSDFWDESKYPLELHESLREIEATAGDKVVFLKKFVQFIKCEQAIEWGKAHGYRLAFPAEREAFAKANPDLQREFLIVDLGSFAVSGGRRYVPVLARPDGKRDLSSRWLDDEWDAGYRFLFVRE